ncbi:uncharacterized protein BDR25DRAFT_67392 [Lindgomyces ingoldianus]|uniref:Uncharacterized protein n=1 Tax=Lindgomyces ingoldianus TaxID=673940 RepID=A0ACB6RBC1_9PLEO|nr:uncharacterized protein BDR25DRAFT_67392 [Lindgomyces ingoldianus]KAF2476564.1 hypothetical protein BDR25DRAFT_67392 [Lindgomyces ingoldianus]
MHCRIKAFAQHFEYRRQLRRKQRRLANKPAVHHSTLGIHASALVCALHPAHGVLLEGVHQVLSITHLDAIRRSSLAPSPWFPKPEPAPDPALLLI